LRLLLGGSTIQSSGVNKVSVKFRILGPLEVRVNGRAVAIGGPRLRALLALLLLEANRVVSRDRLLAELGDGEALGAGSGALKVQISRLRTVLARAEGGGDRLVSRPPGYMLRVQPGELDLDTFERLVDEARGARESGDLATAAARLREAESLWRGRPLADLEFEPFARIEVERLEELRLVALEERIDAELGLGSHSQLVPELDALVATHPLRERLRGQHMLALYRAGRQPDALEVYRAGRALLVEELALEPSPRLKELEQAILRQEPLLELRSRDRGGAVADTSGLEQQEVKDESGAASSSRRRRQLLAVLSLGGAAVAAGVAISLAASGSTKVSLLDANQLALVSDNGAAVRVAAPLPGAPTAIAAGFGSLWISESGTDRVARIDRKRKTITATIPVGRGPGAIAAGAGDVWVANTLDGTVSRIDAGADAVVQTIGVGTQPSDIAIAGGNVWVANHGDGTITRIDPSTGAVRSVVQEGAAPRALAVEGSTLWAADDGAGTVTRIDARNGKVVDVIHVGDMPAALAATAGGVWVLDQLDSTLSRIDPRRDVVEATVPLAGAPNALAAAGDAIWISNERGRSLSRVDPERLVVTRTVPVGGSPETLATGDGIWVGVAASGSGHRGGTLHIVSGGGAIDTLNPAASSSVNLPPSQLLGLTNDGLVTLDHTDGPDGARLVPDLAISLPRPVDAGRTYTFRLRPRIRYSSGAAIMPTDVSRSFERLFELRSAGASFYLAITGARGCLRVPGRCDLSRGIAANDQTNTVTFHLTRPDPDFLAKLTLQYAFVLPASTPAREANTPLPATGPYEVASYRPGRDVRLVRNPQFHEWSHAAQPDGYPDRIVIRLLPTFAGAARLMAHGGDFMNNVGSLPRNVRSYFRLHHPSQVRVNPSMNTGFLFLNVHAPPFDDVHIRRALNLALDRSRIVTGFGGPAAATPTCQLLPPQLPGYKRYCPYTRDSRPDGRWQGPDLARARRLVAESGTKGMKVIVWDLGGGPPIEGIPPVDALRRLGYRATLRLLPESIYFKYTDDSRNHAQVIEGGWSADYPTANNFIGKLTCPYFVPGSSTVDSSEFCDPAFDRRVAAAAAMQTTNPPAAARLWARLDRELTDRAILLPTVTLNTTDLVSTRVRNYHYNPVWGALVDQLWVR
jgi:YVTN family beta-propeller protein